jgi:peptide/nickel transport system permease protein
VIDRGSSEPGGGDRPPTATLEDELADATSNQRTRRPAARPASFLSAFWINHPVVRFTVRRVIAGVATLLVVSVVIFGVTNILPGDAASAILGKRASGVQLKELRAKMGLDKPVSERYLDWLRGLSHGNFGNSAAGYAAGGRVPVWGLIRPKLENSLVLAGLTFLLAIPLSLFIGVITALRAGRSVDHVLSGVTLALVSVPEFVVGSLLIAVFFAWLGVFPPVAILPPGTSALSNAHELVLPVLTLLCVTTGVAVRMVRAGMIDQLRTDYVKMATLAGLPPRMVVRRYALRNALAPSIQVFALILQYLIGGIIVVEYLFAYPGIGKELVDAVSVRDGLVVQSITVLLAAAYIGINIVADLLVVMVVPRLRTGIA